MHYKLLTFSGHPKGDFCLYAVVCMCLCVCVCMHGTRAHALGYLFSQRVLRRLGHRVVSSDEEDSQVKPDGPSEKAWGKRKTTFYSTDFVDELGGDLL